jgi:hypothetical protein
MRSSVPNRITANFEHDQIIDPHQPSDLTLNTGLFQGLPNGPLHHRFPKIDRAPGHRPVLIIRTPDQQHIPVAIRHNHVDRRHQAVRRRRLRIVIKVDATSHAP